MAVVMPRDFRVWFVGAFSALLDVNVWLGHDGVTANDMADIANNDVLFVEFCAAVADCILNSAVVQNAIQNTTSGGTTSDTIINNTTYSNTVLIAENADANGCTNDARYGRILALLEYINTVQVDFYESVDAATNVLDEVANIVAAAPLIETLPINEAIDLVGTSGEQWSDSYLASYNTQLLESAACNLWCNLPDCNVTIKDVRELILERYNLDSTQGLLNTLSATSLLARIAATVASAGGLTYIGDDMVYISWLLQILAVEASGQFFGVEIGDYVAQAANGSPSGLWSGCQPCPAAWSAVFYGGAGDVSGQGVTVTYPYGSYDAQNDWVEGTAFGNDWLARPKLTFAQPVEITRIRATYDLNLVSAGTLSQSIRINGSQVAVQQYSGTQTVVVSFDVGPYSGVNVLDLWAGGGAGASAYARISELIIDGDGYNPFV